MINSMDMEPEMLKLFPLEREDFEHPLQKQDHDIVTFRPSPEKVMDHLVPNYMKGLIFSVLVGVLQRAECQNDRHERCYHKCFGDDKGAVIAV